MAKVRSREILSDVVLMGSTENCISTAFGVPSAMFSTKAPLVSGANDERPSGEIQGARALRYLL